MSFFFRITRWLSIPQCTFPLPTFLESEEKKMHWNQEISVICKQFIVVLGASRGFNFTAEVKGSETP